MRPVRRAYGEPMAAINRVLDPKPIHSLRESSDAGGGQGIEAARKFGGSGTLEELEAAGLRGRGGAGFPTAIKWRTVAENKSESAPLTVVVNAAEGEPGSFKDRSLLRTNPFKVLEGALIAAHALEADRVVVALKSSFATEKAVVDAAIAELGDSGWSDGVSISTFSGPDDYLFGEETGLLEALEGRPPFPRISPPYRRGAGLSTEGDIQSAADKQLAGPGETTAASPTLVNNAETFAHVAMILANGATWFREQGTDASPGTVVCTVTGSTKRAGVAEFAFGTPLAEVIETIGGRTSPGDSITAVVSGVANPLLPGHLLSTPIGFEEMEQAGTSIGAAGFIVFDDSVDIVAAVGGISRFLAVESCGQCVPCKRDGLALSDLLDQMRRSETGDQPELAVAGLADFAETVVDEARCFLASQHQRVVMSLLSLFPDEVRARASGTVPAVGAFPIVPLVDIADGLAVYEESQLTKQPDWTHDDIDSGQWPAQRMDPGQGES